MALVFVLWALGRLFDLPASLRVHTLIPSWHGMVLGLVCLMQFAASLVIDRRYETRVGRTYFWVIWYPVAYWLLGLLTTLVALPRTLLAPRGARAVWTSPDRGIRGGPR